ncbi:hypothetical protein SmJEL517_g03195 [Synchytrium microbalum]|uniref:Sister chromatid cohesion protein n=1 Tax=Synchytrium microbalum TaxID=1806994 RepID=A0A507C7D0_9FUNG|nr:uncharacterized protein SmJEL517_g03195 [Synchytrium microbalum]TPX33974.1 hypothetical protein SmJEL517_g03195 [Synchytrium microbalum]
MADPFDFDGGAPRSSPRSRKTTTNATTGGAAVQPRLTKLRFNDKIVPVTAAKPISSTKLVDRLNALSTELSKMEQERADTKSLDSYCKDLISPSLIMHKDKGVKILTACCIADMLRLYAPDAPYTENDLRDIFELFISQLKYLADPTNSYAPKYNYLLEQLSSVKSIVLVTDLNGADDLITLIFKECLELIQPSTSKPIYASILDILICLVDECAAVPEDVVDMILDRFKKRKRDENPTAYALVINLCNAGSDKLQRYVFQHFADIITTSVKDHDEDDDEKDENEIQKAHKLIAELYRSCPGVLLNVIPLVEEEMKVDDDGLRMLATTVLGDMFAESSSRLGVSFPGVWKTWRNDKNQAIRLKLFDYAPKIFKNHPELAGDISACLEQKLRDPDDKVRLACIKVVQSLDLVLASLLSKNVLTEVGERCRDKKVSMRSEAITALSKLYKLAYNDIIKTDDIGRRAKERFEWIPGVILDTFYLDDAETLVWAEKALDEDILTHIENHKERTERLLNVMLSLSPRSRGALTSFFGLQAKTQVKTAFFLETCVKYNGGVMDENEDQIRKQMKKILEALTVRFPDPQKAKSNLMKFATNNEARLYKLIRAAMDPNSEYKHVYKAIKEIQTRLKETPAVLETIQILLRRVSFLIISRHTIPALLEHITHSEGESKALADQLVKELISIFPGLGKQDETLQDFSKTLRAGDEDMAIISDRLEAYASLIKRHPTKAPTDTTSLTRLSKFVKDGTPSEARHAMIILAHSTASERFLKELLGYIVDSFIDVDQHRLLTHLSGLAELARHAPALFDTRTTEIVDFLVKDLLRKNRDGSTDPMEVWVEVEKAPAELGFKLSALKILVKRLMAVSKTDNSIPDLAQPVFRLLRTIIQNNGLVFATQPECPMYQAYLRREAAVSMIRLNKRSVYLQFMEFQDYVRLATIAQDKYFQAREAVYDTLKKNLDIDAISSSFLPIIIYGAFEPEDQLRARLRTFLTRYASTMSRNPAQSKQTAAERSLVRFIHLLSHDADFDGSVEILAEYGGYFMFFLDAIAHQRNVGFMYTMVGELKLHKDRLADDSTKLYILSDLAQKVIREWSLKHHFTIDAHEGKMSMPKDLFEKLTSVEASEIIRKNYVPANVVIDSTTSTITAATISKKASPKSIKAKTSAKAKEAEAGSDDDSSSSEIQMFKRKPTKRARKAKDSTPNDDDIESGSEADGGEPVPKKAKKAAGKKKAVPESTRKMASRAAKRTHQKYAEKNSDDEEGNDDKPTFVGAKQATTPVSDDPMDEDIRVEPAGEAMEQDNNQEEEEEEKLVDPRVKRRQMQNGHREADKENELNQSSTGILVDVNTLFEDETRVADDGLRMLASAVLGDMATQSSLRVVAVFFGGRKDKNQAIRLKGFDYAPMICKKYPEFAGNIIW